ncbi:MAG: hypothetical protein U9N41_05035 [Euryarchaeota archaeon]|nr:hypothetical protein [Euryarchaeota archaeon]
MFSQRIREIILRRKKKTVGEKTVSGEVDAETFNDLDKMKRNFGLPKKQIVSDAIDAWVKNDLKIDETNLIGNQKKPLSVGINTSLKKKYNEKMEKEGRVKYISLGLIIKAYIDNTFKDEGALNFQKLLNERRKYRERCSR